MMTETICKSANILSFSLHDTTSQDNYDAIPGTTEINNELYVISHTDLVPLSTAITRHVAAIRQAHHGLPTSYTLLLYYFKILKFKQR
jgi:hypothetical protein